MIFMINNMLRIENLTVRVDNRLILKEFSLNINKGEVHVLLGPNGAGKTTLIKAIMGFSKYVVESGKIYFKGEDITNLSISERVSKGIGVLYCLLSVIRNVIHLFWKQTTMFVIQIWMNIWII